MRSCLIFLLVIVVCSAAASPPEITTLHRQRRQLDILANIRQLIEELIENLRAAANEALEAVKTFEYGLFEQASLVREKLMKDLEDLRTRVTQAVQGVVDKITGSGTAVTECVELHRNDAAVLYNDTMSNAMECADERIAEIGLQIQNLKNHSNEALVFADGALIEMQKCVEENPGNIFNVGSCLGSVALKTEAKGAVFVAQSAISIARVNLALATIPAALEVCVGTNLVSAGMATSKIVMEIGSCSASSVYNNLVGNTF